MGQSLCSRSTMSFMTHASGLSLMGRLLVNEQAQPASVSDSRLHMQMHFLRTQSFLPLSSTFSMPRQSAGQRAKMSRRASRKSSLSMLVPGRRSPRPRSSSPTVPRSHRSRSRRRFKLHFHDMFRRLKISERELDPRKLYLYALQRSNDV